MEIHKLTQNIPNIQHVIKSMCIPVTSETQKMLLVCVCVRLRHNNFKSRLVLLLFTLPTKTNYTHIFTSADRLKRLLYIYKSIQLSNKSKNSIGNRRKFVKNQKSY